MIAKGDYRGIVDGKAHLLTRKSVNLGCRLQLRNFEWKNAQPLWMVCNVKKVDWKHQHRIDLIKVMLRNRADVNSVAKCNRGYCTTSTPLGQAAKFGLSDIVLILLQNGANLNVWGAEHPLLMTNNLAVARMLALKHNDVEFIKLFKEFEIKNIYNLIN